MIKFAVVGQGHIGKRHAEMIRRNPDSELVAVCDTLPKEKLGLNDITEPYFNSFAIKITLRLLIVNIKLIMH